MRSSAKGGFSRFDETPFTQNPAHPPQFLSSAVLAFRARDRVPIDWFAVVWVGIILFWQLQFSWATFELSPLVHVWSLLHFILLVMSALFLFVSGALIQPSSDLEDEDCLSRAFQRDGRWSLVVLSTYFATGDFTNWFPFNVPHLSYIGGLIVLLMAIPLVFLWLSNQSAKTGLLLAYIAPCLWSGSVMSPSHD